MPNNDRTQNNDTWGVDQSRRLYNMSGWSGGYFDVNAAGRVIVKPELDANHPGVELYALIEQLQRTGLSLPILIRFRHILRDRIHQIRHAFSSAKYRFSYTGHFLPVYPIKVNQQLNVVDAILNADEDPVGLEAGSKPELIAVMAAIGDTAGPVICNGYKDRQYIRLALIGLQLGCQVYIVIEKPSELDIILRQAKAMKVRPLLGVRVRLTSIVNGKWQNTGGEKGKFGLTAKQTLDLVTQLKSYGWSDCLQLMHVHMGSQIPDIADIRTGMREAARYYAELIRLGVNLKTIDVGGGLGIDYEGTKSLAYCSMNYTLQDYADAVIGMISGVCREFSVRCPDILTEAGRAMTAHHAVLITNVIAVESWCGQELSVPKDTDGPSIIENLKRLLKCSHLPSDQTFQKATVALKTVQDMYLEGGLSILHKAQAEVLYQQICMKLNQHLVETVDDSEVIEQLREKVADKYFCNFSVFQSVPDVWAFNQIFPIMPIHRLNEKPTRIGILQDLTCDSDGQIRNYVQCGGIESTLPMYEVRGDEPYLMGLFLVGAYQEILGDMHNLFGDTHSVNIEFLAGGDARFVEPERGDTIGVLLRYVHFDTHYLLESYRNKLNNSSLDHETRRRYSTEIEASLSAYTYLK